MKQCEAVTSLTAFGNQGYNPNAQATARNAIVCIAGAR